MDSFILLGIFVFFFFRSFIHSSWDFFSSDSSSCNERTLLHIKNVYGELSILIIFSRHRPWWVQRKNNIIINQRVWIWHAWKWSYFCENEDELDYFIIIFQQKSFLLNYSIRQIMNLRWNGILFAFRNSFHSKNLKQNEIFYNRTIAIYIFKYMQRNFWNIREIEFT